MGDLLCPEKTYKSARRKNATLERSLYVRVCVCVSDEGIYSGILLEILRAYAREVREICGRWLRERAGNYHSLRFERAKTTPLAVLAFFFLTGTPFFIKYKSCVVIKISIRPTNLVPRCGGLNFLFDATVLPVLLSEFLFTASSFWYRCHEDHT